MMILRLSLVLLIMRLPPLPTLPVFEAVARLNSFSRAAEELRISQSAVSHRIKQLEDYLGEPLFVRAGRRLGVTTEGQRYLQEISPALGQIEQASEHLRGEDRTHLRLAVFSSFAVRWLIPRLPDLHRRHPTINLMLEMDDGSPSLSNRVADCFITTSARKRGYTAELLYAERLFPICSRKYWDWMRRDLRHAGLTTSDTPDSIEAAWLQRYPLLSASSILGQPGEDWRFWLSTAGCPVQSSTRVHHFSHMLMAHAAARHHQGVALSNDYMLDPADDADLVALPADTIPTGDEFLVAFKTSRRNEPGLRQLKGWLVQQAASSGLKQ